MNKKILLGLLFLLCILLIPSFCSANFTVTYENEEIDFGDIDSQLMQFTLVYPRVISGKVDAIYLYTFDKEPVVKDGKVSVVANCSAWTYYFVNKKIGQFWDNVKVTAPNLVVVSDIPGGFLYLSFDLKDEDGNIVFGSTTKIKFNLTVEPAEKTTNVPVCIHTDYYSLEDFSDILVQYSYDNKKYTTCKTRRLTDSSSQFDGMYQFYLDVYNNDTYYFKFTNFRNNDEEYVTVVIKNIVYTQDNPRKLY